MFSIFSTITWKKFAAHRHSSHPKGQGFYHSLDNVQTRWVPASNYASASLHRPSRLTQLLNPHHILSEASPISVSLSRNFCRKKTLAIRIGFDRGRTDSILSCFNKLECRDRTSVTEFVSYTFGTSSPMRGSCSSLCCCWPCVESRKAMRFELTKPIYTIGIDPRMKS